MNPKLRKLSDISIFKTLRMNFHYLPCRQAMRLPLLVSRFTVMRELKGTVSFACRVRPGMVQIGFDTLGIISANGRNNVV